MPKKLDKNFIDVNKNQDFKITLISQTNPLTKKLSDISSEYWDKILIRAKWDDIFDKIINSEKLLVPSDSKSGGCGISMISRGTKKTRMTSLTSYFGKDDYEFFKFANEDF